MSKMQQLVKLEGFGNVRMAEAEIPKPGPDEVLVKLKRSLISRGSELFRRYVMEEAVSPDIMGYSDAGDIVEVGEKLEGYEVGQRVMAVAPHAQYVAKSPLGDSPRVFPISDEMTYETATFLPLTTSALMWTRTTPIEPGDTVVIMGQGIVGALCLQTIRERDPGRVITVDAQDLRCDISGKLGADVVINCSKQESVAAVRSLTDGRGADVVLECVGGKAGVESFNQAKEMIKGEGIIHLVALYHGQPLEIDASYLQSKMLLGGIRLPEPRTEHMKEAAQLLVDGRVRVDDLITHRLPWQQTPDAYHMLYNNPGEALGVILEWD